MTNKSEPKPEPKTEPKKVAVPEPQKPKPADDEYEMVKTLMPTGQYRMVKRKKPRR